MPLLVYVSRRVKETERMKAIVTELRYVELRATGDIPDFSAAA